MDIVDALQKGKEDRFDLFFRKRTAMGLNHLVEGTALNEIHDHINRAVGLEIADDLDDVGVAQSRQGAGLFQKSVRSPRKGFLQVLGLRHNGRSIRPHGNAVG